MVTRHQEFAETLLRVPIALGTISNLEQEMSAALAPAHAEAQQAVQQAAAKNVDETGWKKAGAKRWLWGAATALVACFVIAPTRGAAGLAELLGKKIKGVVSSDRWSVYGQLKLGLRQLCWAHLKRDFQKWSTAAALPATLESAAWASSACCFTNGICIVAVAAGRRCSVKMAPMREAMRDWLEEGTRCKDAKAAALCGNLLEVDARCRMRACRCRRRRH